MKELRSEYFAAITLCAERLAAELARTPGLSVVQLLRKGGLVGTPQQVTTAVSPLLLLVVELPAWRGAVQWAQCRRLLPGARQCSPPACLTVLGPLTHPSPDPTLLLLQLTTVLEQLEHLLQWLSTALDTRVFVALARGLWDLTAKDVLDYAEDLREGRGGEAHAWRGRQNAHASLLLLDRFFKSVLTRSMGNDLQDKDLNLPQHADRAHKLLADTMATVQMSYDVY